MLTGVGTRVARAAAVVGVAVPLLAGLACSADDPPPTASTAEPADDPADAGADAELCAAWLATTDTDDSQGDQDAAIQEMVVNAEAVRANVPDELSGEADEFIAAVEELGEIGSKYGWDDVAPDALTDEERARLRELTEQAVRWGSTSPLADHVYERCESAGAADPRFHLPCIASRFQPIPMDDGADPSSAETEPDLIAEARVEVAGPGWTFARRDLPAEDGATSEAGYQYALIDPGGTSKTILDVRPAEPGRWATVDERTCR